MTKNNSKYVIPIHFDTNFEFHSKLYCGHRNSKPIEIPFKIDVHMWVTPFLSPLSSGTAPLMGQGYLVVISRIN